MLEVLLVVAVSVLLVGAVLLVRRQRGVRRNRGEEPTVLAGHALSTGLLPAWVTDRLDAWLSKAHPRDGERGDADDGEDADEDDDAAHPGFGDHHPE